MKSRRFWVQNGKGYQYEGFERKVGMPLATVCCFGMSTCISIHGAHALEVYRQGSVFLFYASDDGHLISGMPKSVLNMTKWYLDDKFRQMNRRIWCTTYRSTEARAGP